MAGQSEVRYINCCMTGKTPRHAAILLSGSPVRSGRHRLGAHRRGRPAYAPATDAHYGKRMGTHRPLGQFFRAMGLFRPRTRPAAHARAKQRHRKAERLSQNQRAGKRRRHRGNRERAAGRQRRAESRKRKARNGRTGRRLGAGSGEREARNGRTQRHVRSGNGFMEGFGAGTGHEHAGTGDARDADGERNHDRSGRGGRYARNERDGAQSGHGR